MVSNEQKTGSPSFFVLPPKDYHNSFVVLISCVVVMGLQFLMSFNFAWFQSLYWLTVPCKITASSIGHLSVDLSQNKPGFYTADISFTYKIDGKSYTSNRTHFLLNFTNEIIAQKIVSKYPAGLNTICYVNPHNPREAVLRRLPTLDTLENLNLLFIPIILLAEGPYLLIKSRQFRHTYRRLELEMEAVPNNTIENLINKRFEQNSKLFLAPSTMPVSQFFIWLFWTLFFMSFFYINFIILPANLQSGRDYSILTALFLFSAVLYSFSHFVFAFGNLFRPVVYLRPTPFALKPADVLKIDWQIPHPQKITKLTLRIKGRCDTPFFSPDIEDLFTRNKKYTLLKTSKRDEISVGYAIFTVPDKATTTPDLMWDTWPWSIELRLKCSPLLPAFHYSYPFLIIPPPLDESQIQRPFPTL